MKSRRRDIIDSIIVSRRAAQDERNEMTNCPRGIRDDCGNGPDGVDGTTHADVCELCIAMNAPLTDEQRDLIASMQH